MKWEYCFGKLLVAIKASASDGKVVADEVVVSDFSGNGMHVNAKMSRAMCFVPSQYSVCETSWGQFHHRFLFPLQYPSTSIFADNPFSTSTMQPLALHCLISLIAVHGAHAQIIADDRPPTTLTTIPSHALASRATNPWGPSSTTVCHQNLDPPGHGNCEGRQCGPNNYWPSDLPTVCVTVPMSEYTPMTRTSPKPGLDTVKPPEV